MLSSFFSLRQGFSVLVIKMLASLLIPGEMRTLSTATNPSLKWNFDRIRTSVSGPNRARGKGPAAETDALPLLLPGNHVTTGPQSTTVLVPCNLHLCKVNWKSYHSDLESLFLPKAAGNQTQHMHRISSCPDCKNTCSSFDFPGYSISRFIQTSHCSQDGYQNSSVQHSLKLQCLHFLRHGSYDGSMFPNFTGLFSHFCLSKQQLKTYYKVQNTESTYLGPGFAKS